MGRWLGKILAAGGPQPPTPPPFGFYASPTGSATGAGTIGDPWTLTVALAGGFPGGTLSAGETCWLRGGTYTGRHTTTLNGSAGNEITFRGYPGERVILDGGLSGVGNAIIELNNAASYIILRDLEMFNSGTQRKWIGYDQHMGDGAYAIAPHCKVINCVMHDCAEGITSFTTGRGVESYGNLVYHNGWVSDTTEASDMMVAIDLAPSGGTPVALAGAVSHGNAPSSPTTFSHTHAGDYLVVAANAMKSGSSYTTLSATYDGVAMSLLQGVSNGNGGGAVALFGLATTNTGAHNVVVTQTGSTIQTRCTAHSFANVGSGAAAGSDDIVDLFDLAPLQVVVTSAANHMVVDAVFLGEGPDFGNYHSTGATRTFTDDYVGIGSSHLDVSTAAGAASVTMGWAWDLGQDGFGHGSYQQEGEESNLVQCSSGDQTVTITSGPAWHSTTVGSWIFLQGAGVAGADLVTTIQTWNNNFSIEVTVAPSTNVTNGYAVWAPGKLIKDNIWYEGLGDNTLQCYGTGGANFVNSTVEGNLFVNKPLIVGGLSSFRVNDTVTTGNYLWNTKAWPGYHGTLIESFSFLNNYVHSVIEPPAASEWPNMTMTGNTFIGTIAGFTSADFPTNDYTYTLPASPPTANQVILRNNTYEVNRANLYVYNWENLTSVNVDISPAVAPGTWVFVMNAQDYYAAPVWRGYYTGGMISLPMTGLTVQAGIGYAATGLPAAVPTGQAFNAFIIRTQTNEYWRV